jgi:hypothetical protein
MKAQLLPNSRTKFLRSRGKSLLPAALLVTTFGFCALQLFLHPPAHDATLWSFPTIAPLLAINKYNASKSDVEDGISAPSSSSWGWKWWWEWGRGRQRRKHGGMDQVASKYATDRHTVNAHRPAYHLVFSTSCGPQQDWESFVFFYHAFKVRQPGNVVRV